VTDHSERLALLGAPGATLTKTLQAVESLERDLPLQRQASIGIACNVSVDLLSTYLRKHALLCGVRLEVRMGSHDDALGDADRFVSAGLQAMLLFAFFDNLMPAFEHQLEHLEPQQVAAKEAEVRARWRLLFEKAKSVPIVFAAGFHRFGPAVDTGRADPVQTALERFNAALREEAGAFANVRLIDTQAIVHALGSAAAFDPRFYFRSTAPYSAAFLDELARRIAASSRGFGSYFHKALVLDCDNTLWGGIVGEDLLQGIKLDPHDYPGKVFWRAQHEFLSLERQGVLLCLCSKNNGADVDEVLTTHPHCLIRDRHLALRKVNWHDKVANLRAIAGELNIGLDSLVFLDDSPFECEAVRAELPMVRVFQVPSNLPDYPRLIHQIKELFLCPGVADESRSKTQQYRRLQAAAASSAHFASHDEYLASLDLRVDLLRNNTAQVERISELTRKSNQFNLTTLRLSPGEIRNRMENPATPVYSLTVQDRFGSAGLTGVLLLTCAADAARVDAFLMSCRVIGRGVEFSIWPDIARDAQARGCKIIQAEYRPTPKNMQVADFYDRLGLPLVEELDGVRHYRATLDDFNPKRTDWIKVTHGDG
jgi:FkbH-like protein